MQVKNLWAATKKYTSKAISVVDEYITKVEDWTDAPIKKKLMEEMQITYQCTKKMSIDAIYCPCCKKQLRVVD